MRKNTSILSTLKNFIRDKEFNREHVKYMDNSDSAQRMGEGGKGGPFLASPSAFSPFFLRLSPFSLPLSPFSLPPFLPSPSPFRPSRMGIHNAFDLSWGRQVTVDPSLVFIHHYSTDKIKEVTVDTAVYDKYASSLSNIGNIYKEFYKTTET